jgi:hypothetical protein
MTQDQISRADYEKETEKFETIKLGQGNLSSETTEANTTCTSPLIRYEDLVREKARRIRPVLKSCIKTEEGGSLLN